MTDDDRPDVTDRRTDATLVHVLGPVTATVGGRPCLVSSPKQRGVLALLAVDAGRVVSVGRLMDELWGEEPPDSAASTLQVYVSRLRRSLGDVPGAGAVPPVRIRRQAPGYVLELPEGGLDAWRLARLTEAAQAVVATDPVSALRLLDQGLGLVTGEPLVDVVDALGPGARAEAHRLGELVLGARESRLEALLGVGRPAEAAAAAEHLLLEHPLRETLHALRLLALYRAGRQGDALAAYQELRERLSDDLGVDPGPALRRLHTQLLQHDPSLDWRPPAVAPLPTDRRSPSPEQGLEQDREEALDPDDEQPGDEFSPPRTQHALLGRDQELGLLRRAVRRTATGQGGVWVLSGEAGIGKTRLAQEVAAEARAGGTRVAEGRAAETSDAAPYWLWGQVFRHLPRVPRDGPVGVLLGTGTANDGVALSQPALHEALAQLLVEAAEASGSLLLLLEDLHWADEASLALLWVVAERTAGSPLMLLCTYRLEDAEPVGVFGALLARLARMPFVERLLLTGLDDHHARALLAERLGWEPDVATAAEAADRTAGNPLFLQELARLVRDADDPDQAWNAVPETVHDILVHRLNLLPRESRRLLDVAAVIGRECDLGLLEVASGLPADEVDTGLAAAVLSGMVTEVVAPLPVLRFPHALMREALYSQLGARARMRLHAAVGSAMSALPGVDVDDLVHQLLAGGDLVEPELAVSAALMAVDRAMVQQAFAHGQELLDRALPLLDRMAPGVRRDGLELALQTRYGTVVGTRLGFAAPDAQAALERALDLALRVEPGPDVFAAVYRRYLWLLMGGDFAAVRRLAGAVLDQAAQTDGAVTRDRFTLLGRLALGSVLWCLGEAEAAVDELEAALRLAEHAGVGVAVAAFGDPAVRIRMFLCHALAAAGREDEALVVADEMVRQAHLSGPADESDALATRGMMFVAFGEAPGARADGVEGRRLSRLAGANLLEHFADLNDSWGSALLDDLAERSDAPDSSDAAVAMARAATAAYLATGTRMHDPIVWTMLAEVEAAGGDPARAETAASSGLAALARSGSRLWQGRLEAVLAAATASPSAG